jgi:ankyrin repeat protein
MGFPRLKMKVKYLSGYGMHCIAIVGLFCIFCGPEKKSELISSVILGQKAKVQKIIDSGGNINKPDKNGLTPLMWAINSCKNDILLSLIEHGANVNIQDEDGQTALMHIANQPCIPLSTVKKLIEHGANLETKNKGGLTPLHLAIINKRDSLALLFIENKANINEQDGEGQSALAYAVIGNEKDAVHLLLRFGANVQIKDHDGKSALDIAKENGNKEIISILNKAIPSQ